MKPVMYVPGQTFTCWQRPHTFDPAEPDGVKVGEPCGATVVMHEYWWCAQVCPKCLANYHASWATPMTLRLDTAGYYPPEIAAEVRARIAECGGQYVPKF